MNTDVLKRLSLEQLRKLSKAVDVEISSRMDFRILPGRTGYFVDNKGEKQFIVVDRVNPKSITVKPTNGRGGGWRCPASMLVMDGVSVLDSKDRRRTPTTSPSETYSVEAW